MDFGIAKVNVLDETRIRQSVRNLYIDMSVSGVDKMITEVLFFSYSTLINNGNSILLGHSIKRTINESFFRRSRQL